MEAPTPEHCSVCDFDFEPYQKVIVVLRLQLGGDGMWYILTTEAIHAHCWSTHVSADERRQ
jgi:hypothetical protein